MVDSTYRACWLYLHAGTLSWYMDVMLLLVPTILYTLCLLVEVLTGVLNHGYRE